MIFLFSLQQIIVLSPLRSLILSRLSGQRHGHRSFESPSVNPSSNSFEEKRNDPRRDERKGLEGETDGKKTIVIFFGIGRENERRENISDALGEKYHQNDISDARAMGYSNHIQSLFVDGVK